MTGPFLVLAGTELLAQQVGVFRGDIQHRLLARRLIVSYGRLVEMSHVIEFMTQQMEPEQLLR